MSEENSSSSQRDNSRSSSNSGSNSDTQSSGFDEKDIVTNQFQQGSQENSESENSFFLQKKAPSNTNSKPTADQTEEKIRKNIALLQQLFEDEEDPNLCRKYQEKLKKFQSLQLMRRKLMDQEKLLKTRYLTIIKERNIYFKKVRAIETYGQGREWVDDSGMLDQIYGLLVNPNNEEEQNEE